MASEGHGSLNFGDDLVRVHAIAKDATNDDELSRAQIPQPSFYLIRPDGHIGLCGSRLETGELITYFAQNLYLNTTGAHHVKERAAASG
jgi:hypothetical protein